MLTVAKLRAGQEIYYEREIAQGLEDYYSGRGELVGVWHGRLAHDLGLFGEADSDGLRAVFAGRPPVAGAPEHGNAVSGSSVSGIAGPGASVHGSAGDGESGAGSADPDAPGAQTSRVWRRRVAAFDLTFSAPKSVSLLWCFGGPEVADAVVDAHTEAVAAGLDYLQDAVGSRTGHAGALLVHGGGFWGVAFRHRASRDADPQIHTHVVIANQTRCDDGVWRALDGRDVYAHAKTAGFLYQAELRAALTARLGVEWLPVVEGQADIVGVSRDLIEVFSSRRDAILDELAARGLSSPKAAQAAALDTRRAKEYGIDATTLHGQWRQRAEHAGMTTDLRHTLDRAQTPTRRVEERGVVERLLCPEGLTARASSFDRRDVIQAVVHAAARLAADDARRLADQVLADVRVVPLGVGSERLSRYSTVELLALEQRLLDQAVSRRDADVAVVSAAALDAGLAVRRSLSSEQVDLVAALASSGNGIDVVIAAAGTGKTYSLAAAAEVWRSDGYRIIGAALAATAAAELHDATGIPSDTIAMRLIQLARSELQLDTRTVLVVDEAAMAGTRQLAGLLDAAADADAKVVLVGDPGQLQAIDAGGLLAGVSRRQPPIVLRENRRQREPWERDALAALRRGDIEHALDAYRTNGRLHTAPTVGDVREQMVTDWYAARRAGDDALMVAQHRAEVTDLNRRARQRLVDDRIVQGPGLSHGEVVLQAGDEIICLRNNRKLGLRNGMTATIVAIDADAKAVRFVDGDQQPRSIPWRYIDAGNVAHAYAITIHKAQGRTVDRCFVLASDHLDRQAGYVALSRGRDANRLYLPPTLPDPELHARDLDAEHEPEAVIAAALATSHVEALAVDQHPDRTARRLELDQLQCDLEHYRQLEAGTPPDRSRDLNALGNEHASRERERDRAARALSDAERRLTLKRGERRAAIAAAQRGLDKAEQRLAAASDALATVEAAQQRRESYILAHGDPQAKGSNTATAIIRRVWQLIDSYRDDPPAYLAHLGAAPPRGSYDEQRWRSDAAVIEIRRIRNRIIDDHTLIDRDDRTIAPADMSVTLEVPQVMWKERSRELEL